MCVLFVVPAAMLVEANKDNSYMKSEHIYIQSPRPKKHGHAFTHAGINKYYIISCTFWHGCTCSDKTQVTLACMHTNKFCRQIDVENILFLFVFVCGVSRGGMVSVIVWSPTRHSGGAGRHGLVLDLTTQNDNDAALTLRKQSLSEQGHGI